MAELAPCVPEIYNVVKQMIHPEPHEKLQLLGGLG